MYLPVNDERPQTQVFFVPSICFGFFRRRYSVATQRSRALLRATADSPGHMTGFARKCRDPSSMNGVSFRVVKHRSGRGQDRMEDAVKSSPTISRRSCASG